MSSPEKQPKAAQNQRLRALDAEAELERARSALAAVKAELNSERIAHAATESDLVAHAEACHAQAAALAAAAKYWMERAPKSPTLAEFNHLAALAAYEKEQKQ